MSSLLLPLVDLGAYIDGREPTSEVQVDKLKSGKTLRSTYQTSLLTQYTVKQERLRSDAVFDYQRWLSWFKKHFGQLDSFLLDDPEDDSVTDHGFAVGDGSTTAFQLQRTTAGSYIDAGGNLYNQCTKPYTNSVKNSSFEFDSNGDGLADNWIVYNNSAATEPAIATIVPGVNGGKAQRIAWGTNSTNTKGVTQAAATTPLTGQWYTISGYSRASPSNIGKFVGNAWSITPAQVVVIACPPLSGSFQRYVFQVQWSAAQVPTSSVFWSISNVNTGAPPQSNPTGTFGWIDFDQLQFTPGQWGLNDLQPVETPAASGGTDLPALWPNSYTDGYGPIFDTNGDTSIFQDGDWMGRRQLFPFARTNLIGNSAAIDLWTAVNVTITANSTVAPDGTTTADTFNEGTAVTVQHNAHSTTAPADIAGELRCWSVFVKANTLPNINISAPGAFGTGVNFNLSTGLIDSTTAGPVTSGVQTSPLWPGWFRVWFVRRGSATGSNLFLSGCLDATYSSAGYTGTSRTFFAWGGMCERVSDVNGPSPYIPTPTAAAVTVTDYTLGSTGIVTLAAALPAPSAAFPATFLSWTGKYYIRVRLDQGSLPLARIVLSMWSTGLRLVEARL